MVKVPLHGLRRLLVFVTGVAFRTRIEPDRPQLGHLG
jgi:hypothetical protein